MFIVDKSWETAAENLAYEYSLLHEMALNHPGLTAVYLWQNKDTVVIGRNQNPYKECDLAFIRKEGIELVRRITGGGAVYHDQGNLNYSFICNKKTYDRGMVFQCIVDALGSIGIPCEINGRNDIAAGDYKISGNAFYCWHDMVLHHGTIMVDVDVERMGQCLTPCKAKFASKGVASVKGRVHNLSKIKESISVGQVKRAILSEFGKYSKTMDYALDVNEAFFQSAIKKFASQKWIYGDYPENYETISGHFGWGNVTVGFALDGNIVTNCFIESDSMFPHIIGSVEKDLKGMDLSQIPERRNEIIEKNDAGAGQAIAEDLLDLIAAKLI